MGGCKGGIQGGRKEESKEVREQSRVGAKRRECKGESKKVKFSKKHLRETISSSLKIKIPVVRNESSGKKVEH